MTRRKCLVLGAGGLVGQRLQQRLVNQPMFDIVAVAGSPSSADKQLSSIPWRLDEIRPDLPELLVVDANDPNLTQHCQSLGVEIAFSGLPSSVAQSVEQVLVDAGITVFSNSSAYRRKPNVPMIIPEINPHHNYPSKHYCATNCTLIPLNYLLLFRLRCAVSKPFRVLVGNYYSTSKHYQEMSTLTLKEKRKRLLLNYFMF